MATEISKITEEWIVDTEDEVKELIEQAKKDTSFELIKYEFNKKEKKSKGEVIDTWFTLKLTKKY